MIQSRFFRIVISLTITIGFMLLLVVLTSKSQDSRILIMLGGTMPEGIIQGCTYWLFFFGMFEIFASYQRIDHETEAFLVHLLPERDNWILNPEDVNELKLRIQQFSQSNNFLLADLVQKACIKYRLSKSSSETLGLIEAQIRLYGESMESESTYINYVAWAIPSVGFIGTVLGIAASLGYANEASTPEGIEKVTSMLAVAFDTTLVALFLSIILMFMIHYNQKQQEQLLFRMSNYVIDNFVNRLYK